MIKQTLRFISFLFSKVEGLKLNMANQDMFLILLDSFYNQDESCKNHILNFFKLELLTSEESNQSGDRLSWLSDSSNSAKNNTIVNLLS